MAKPTAKNAPPKKKVVARNRRASHDFHLSHELEAGIELRGSEVKAMREGGTAIDQAYCAIEGGELFLLASNIPPFAHASWDGHTPTRKRKLLLKKTELRKLEKELRAPGTTIVPLEIYFNEKNFAKIAIAVGRGKQEHDKRADISKREANREIARAIGRRR